MRCHYPCHGSYSVKKGHRNVIVMRWCATQMMVGTHPGRLAAAVLAALAAALNVAQLAAAKFHSGELAYVRETFTNNVSCADLPEPNPLSLVVSCLMRSATLNRSPRNLSAAYT